MNFYENHRLVRDEAKEMVFFSRVFLKTGINIRGRILKLPAQLIKHLMQQISPKSCNPGDLIRNRHIKAEAVVMAPTRIGLDKSLNNPLTDPVCL